MNNNLTKNKPVTVVLWGGIAYEDILPFIKELEKLNEIKVCALVNNKPHKEKDNYPVIYANELADCNYNKILITAEAAYDNIITDIKKMNIDVSICEKAWDYIRPKLLSLDCFYQFPLKRQLFILNKIWRKEV